MEYTKSIQCFNYLIEVNNEERERGGGCCLTQYTAPKLLYLANCLHIKNNNIALLQDSFTRHSKVYGVVLMPIYFQLLNYTAKSLTEGLKYELLEGVQQENNHITNIPLSKEDKASIKEAYLLFKDYKAKWLKENTCRPNSASAKTIIGSPILDEKIQKERLIDTIK